MTIAKSLLELSLPEMNGVLRTSVAVSLSASTDCIVDAPVLFYRFIMGRSTPPLLRGLQQKCANACLRFVVAIPNYYHVPNPGNTVGTVLKEFYDTINVGNAIKRNTTGTGCVVVRRDRDPYPMNFECPDTRRLPSFPHPLH